MKSLVLLIPCLLLIGCTTSPLHINFLQECSPGHLERFKVPRDCKIAVKEVFDARPQGETGKRDHCNLRYLIPLLIYNQWSSAGPTFNGFMLEEGQSLEQEVAALMQSALDQSGAFSGQGRVYDLHVRINHLYGVEYTKNFMVFAMGGVAVESYDLLPCGYVELDLTLKDSHTGASIGEVVLTRSYLFNPERPGLTCDIIPGTVHIPYADNLKGVVAAAITDAMSDLAGVIDRMVAEAGSGADISAPPKTFRVIRLTDEYDYCEEAEVEFETGKIVSNTVRAYHRPIVSRPGEWIILPEDDSGHWLSAGQYRRMVGLLGEKYDVGFVENLSAATFRGIKTRP